MMFYTVSIITPICWDVELHFGKGVLLNIETADGALNFYDQKKGEDGKRPPWTRVKRSYT